MSPEVLKVYRTSLMMSQARLMMSDDAHTLGKVFLFQYD
jgi:hypothetical protein